MGTVVVAMQKGELPAESSQTSPDLVVHRSLPLLLRTKEPVRQGLVSMTGTFIDTIVICTMTGLSIVIAGSWLNTGTGRCGRSQRLLSRRDFRSHRFVAIILPDAVSGILCIHNNSRMELLRRDDVVEYLFNRNKGAAVRTYRMACTFLAVFIGPYMTVAAVWNIADIFNALMAFPNLIALLALNGVIVKETRDFHAKHNGSY